MEKRKIFHYRESNPDRPGYNPPLYRLSYPDSGEIQNTSLKKLCMDNYSLYESDMWRQRLLLTHTYRRNQYFSQRHSVHSSASRFCCAQVWTLQPILHWDIFLSCNYLTWNIIKSFSFSHKEHKEELLFVFLWKEVPGFHHMKFLSSWNTRAITSTHLTLTWQGPTDASNWLQGLCHVLSSLEEENWTFQSVNLRGELTLYLMFHGEKVLQRRQKESVMCRDVTSFFLSFSYWRWKNLCRIWKQTNSSILTFSVECIHVAVLRMLEDQAFGVSASLYLYIREHTREDRGFEFRFGVWIYPTTIHAVA